MARNTVAATRITDELAVTIRTALELAGVLAPIGPHSRVALKPNFTYPFYKAGVTTSPAVIEETIKIIRAITANIAVVETDGGYGAWKVEEAFEGHGIYEMARKYGIEVVNLNKEPAVPVKVTKGDPGVSVNLPRRLLDETDILISMPVPKIHCMTGLSLGFKNQWGCIPDIMRLRRHHVFDEAIVEINRVLRPAVLADGTFFLDRSGPMEGDAVRMDLIIASDSVGAFDLYASALMGVPWKKVPHLRKAVASGQMPTTLEEIEFNIHPDQLRSRDFHLKRTFRNYIALAGFKSRFITWLGYEAWFGRVVLHKILYAFAGKPVKAEKREDKVNV